MKSGSNLNMLGNIISKFKVEPLATDPSSTPYLGSLSGAMYYNTTSGCYRVNNGQNWVDVVDIKGTNEKITVTYAGNPKTATIDLDPAFASMLVTSYLPLSGGTMSGTMYGPSISATNISASTITVGNVSNTEFGYLDGTSANIQNQLTSLSADRLFATNGVDNRIATFSNSNTLNGEANLTFDGNTDLSIDAAAGPRINLNTTSVSGNTVGIRLRHNSSNKWFVGTDNVSADYVVLDYATSNRDIRITSGSTGLITLGSTTKKVNLPSLATSAVVVTDGSKNLVSSPVTTTELSYLTGATSNIQTQLNNMATTVGLSAYQLRSEKGASLGYAALDSNSKIYTSSIPDTILGQLHYSGTWNATTNSPTLPAPNTVSGAFYIVTVSGTSIPNGLNPNTSASIFSGTNKWFVGDWIVSDGTYWDKIDNTDSISTWNGRTGAIVPIAGDYTATQITNTPEGNIASTTVQAAINELDSEKVATTTTITAGTGLAGGGDLSTNRTISLETTGTSGTYTKVTTDAYGRVTAGTTLTSGDIPTLPPSKILEDANDRFVSDVQIVKWDSVYGSVSGTSANWNSVYSSVNATSASWNAASVSAHNHSNKALLDQIDQSVATSATVYFHRVQANAQALSAYDTVAVDRFVGQTMANNDNWKIYGEGTVSDDGRMVIETGDNGNEAIQLAFRNGNTRNIAYTFLPTSLSASAVTATFGGLNVGNVSNTEISYLSGVTSDIQTQINNIRYGANRFTSAINIVYGAQSFTVNHNLGYLRPTVKLYDEAADDEILVTPIFVSTSQLVIPMSSSEAITGARLEVFV